MKKQTLEQFIKAKYPEIYQEYINSETTDKYGTFKETVEFVKSVALKENPSIGCDKFEYENGHKEVQFALHGHVLFKVVKTITNMGRLDWNEKILGKDESDKATINHRTMTSTVKKITKYVKDHPLVVNVCDMMGDLELIYIDDSKDRSEFSFELIFDNLEGACISYKKGGYPGCNMSFEEFSKAREVTAEQLADKYMATFLERKIGEYDGKQLVDDLIDFQRPVFSEWVGWEHMNAYSREDFIYFFKNCWYID